MECRRCAECETSDHHWIEGGYSGPVDNPWPYYACKHCNTVGQDCPRCHSNEGTIEACLECEGDGIVLATAFLCDGVVLIETSRNAAMAAYELLEGHPAQSVTEVAIVGSCAWCDTALAEGGGHSSDGDGGHICASCAETGDN